MVICHCKAINADFIANLFATRQYTVDELTEQCGAGSDCGTCLDLLACMLDQLQTSPTGLVTPLAVEIHRLQDSCMVPQR